MMIYDDFASDLANIQYFVVKEEAYGNRDTFFWADSDALSFTPIPHDEPAIKNFDVGPGGLCAHFEQSGKLHNHLLLLNEKREDG